MKFIYLYICCSFIYSQCNDYDEFQCNNDNNCDWTEDVEIGNCSDITNSSECYQNNQCSWYSAGNYGYLYDNCYGGTYEIDNSYCQEIEMPECSEMNELECSSDDGCNWIEDTQNISCSSLTIENCNMEDGCFLDQECIQWGSWYTWLCYDYGPLYCAGNYQEDNSYCEEVSTNYQMGDINEDYLINILDVIEIVNLILNGEHTPIADINGDHSVNVIDVIDLINIILNARR